MPVVTTIMLKSILTKNMAQPSGPEEKEVEADAEPSVGSSSPLIQHTSNVSFQTLRKKSSMINELENGEMR